MKNAVILLQVVFFLVSLALAFGLGQPQGFYAFVAGAYEMGILIFLGYIALSRSVEDVVTGKRTVLRAVIPPTALMLGALIVTPFVALLVVTGFSAPFSDVLAAAVVTDLAIIALPVGLVGPALPVLGSTVPPLLIGLCIAAISLPVLYLAFLEIMRWLFVRQGPVEPEEPTPA